MIVKTVPIFYLAHCVGAPTREGIEANLADTRLWLKLLVETISDVAFCVPWLPYVEVLDETKHRERGLRDDHIILDRCDGFVMCGPTLSSGVRGELAHYEANCALLGQRPMVVDLIRAGIAPSIEIKDLAAHVRTKFAPVMGEYRINR
jgi:hypothetical protein